MYNNNIIFEHKDLGSRIKEMVKIRRSGLMDHAWSTDDGHLLRLSVDEKFDGFTYDLIVDGQPFSSMRAHNVYASGRQQNGFYSKSNNNGLPTARPFYGSSTRSSRNDDNDSDEFGSFDRKGTDSKSSGDEGEFGSFDAFSEEDKAKKNKDKKHKKEEEEEEEEEEEK